MPVNGNISTTPVTSDNFTLNIIDIDGRTTSVTTSDIDPANYAAFRAAFGALTMAAVYGYEVRSSEKYLSDPLSSTVYEDAYSSIDHVLTLIFSRYVNSVREVTTVTVPAFDINLKSSPSSDEVDLTEPRIVTMVSLMAQPANGGWSLARATISTRQRSRVVTRAAVNAIVEPATGSVQEPPGENPLNP